MPKIQADSEEPKRPKRRSPRALAATDTIALEQALDGIEPAPAPSPRAPAPRPENPGPGRPTKYDPRFCELLIDHMRTGLSFESFAGAIGVNQDTLHEWAKRHAEFSEAKKIAFSANLLTWEKMGVRGAMGTLKGFNVGAWIFNMKNRHRWNDGQQETEENPLQSVLDQFRQANDALLKKPGQ